MVRSIAASESLPVAASPSPSRTMREKASMTRKPRRVPRATRSRQLLVPRSSAAQVAPQAAPGGSDGGGKGEETGLCTTKRKADHGAVHRVFMRSGHGTPGIAACEARRTPAHREPPRCALVRPRRPWRAQFRYAIYGRGFFGRPMVGDRLTVGQRTLTPPV